MPYFKKIRPVGAALFHADGRTGTHDDANSRFSQFCERTPKYNCTYEYFVFNQCTIFPVSFLFSLRLTPATDNHRSPVTAFSSSCWTQQKHVSAFRPATSYRTRDVWTHCWPRTVPSRNICADQRALQYCSAPCRNIRRRWAYWDSQLLWCNYERLAKRSSQTHMVQTYRWAVWGGLQRTAINLPAYVQEAANRQHEIWHHTLQISRRTSGCTRIQHAR